MSYNKMNIFGTQIGDYAFFENIYNIIQYKWKNLLEFHYFYFIIIITFAARKMFCVA